MKPMITPLQFQELALSFAETELAQHFEKIAFKKNKKIFATVDPSSKVAMVKLTPEQQSVYMLLPGNIFYPATGAWGKQGYTLFNLQQINQKMLKELLSIAWENISSKKNKY